MPGLGEMSLRDEWTVRKSAAAGSVLEENGAQEMAPHYRMNNDSLPSLVTPVKARRKPGEKSAKDKKSTPNTFGLARLAC